MQRHTSSTAPLCSILWRNTQSGTLLSKSCIQIELQSWHPTTFLIASTWIHDASNFVYLGSYAFICTIINRAVAAFTENWVKLLCEVYFHRNPFTFLLLQKSCLSCCSLTNQMTCYPLPTVTVNVELLHMITYDKGHWPDMHHGHHSYMVCASNHWTTTTHHHRALIQGKVCRSNTQ